MATIKPLYGSNAQAITVTLASLANGSAQQSTVIDNTSNLFLDALFQFVVKSGASGVSASGSVTVYAFGTVDGGTTYTDGAGATNASITLPAAPNMVPLFTMSVVTNATTYSSRVVSVASAFGGVLPDHWGIVVVNNSGAALDSTEGNHKKQYQGVQAQSV